MNFKTSTQYLYGLGNEVLAMKLGLENIRTLLAALGNPEKTYPKIQIAGTNGKGSTCAFLEAICVSAKIKTGLFTSPHLISITERIKINGAEISEKDFARHATQIKEISEKLVAEKKLETAPTFFEQTTAIALRAFAEAEIELAILETGLGGRFDATTAAHAEIVGITTIDYDHQQILGNTLSKIAAEKAAIVRRDTKVVLGEQAEEAQEILTSVCADFSVAPKSAQTFEAAVTGKSDAGKLIVDFRTEKSEYKNVKLNLRGRHQIENAKTAILLAETLQESDFKISTENIIEGLQTAVHNGRLEFYKNYLFDGAHNAGGAKALREFLDEFTNQKITFVFGAMRDKDLEEITECLFPKAERLILTRIENARSLNPQQLNEFVPKDFDREKLFAASTVGEALEIADRISGGGDLICISGSLYLIGEARKILRAKNYV